MKKIGWNIIKDISILILILALSTGISILFKTWKLHETNIVMVYIFSVLLISCFTRGYIYGIVASIVSLLLFNYFFTEPYFTLKVDDLTYLITFAIMMFTSIFTSALTTKVKKSALEAKERENEANALYQMTNNLTDAEDKEFIANVIVDTTSWVLSCNTACICFDENGQPERTFIQRKSDGTIIRRDLLEIDELKKRMEQLHEEAAITENDYLYPIYGKITILAVLVVPKDIGMQMSSSQTRMLHSIIESAALALERLQSQQAQARSREETIQERYRGNLLRAISHDIRTPLSSIMGNTEMIIGSSKKYARINRLANDVYRDARWLHDMVENILNLTKLQDGKLALDKQNEAIEEVIGATLSIMEKRLPNRTFDIEMPENVLMVPMDARLISQVLINLLDNADKHSSDDTPITIVVKELKKEVQISVNDEGSGILECDLPHVFQMFYTTSTKSPDSRRGVGLGLAICQSIIEAHGGTIEAKNREGGGASFTFTLPLGGKKYESKK